jgi:hypothetical protein
MRTIWKYILRVDDRFTLKLHHGDCLLTVQTQHNKPYIWVETNPEAPEIEQEFLTFGTGYEIPKTDLQPEYIGTYQLEQGLLVYHVYAILNPYIKR